MDIVSLMGLVFTPIIAALCLLVHKKKRDSILFYFGIAYVLFLLSYIITFSGLIAVSTIIQILLRLMAYLTMIFGLYIRLSARTS